MKVILLQDIKKVGRKYEVKNVADGHALNFLIPNKQAEIATPQAMKKLDSMKTKAEAEKKVQEDLLMKNLKSLSGVLVEVKAPANDKGSLFKGVHKEEIVNALKEQGHLDLLPEHINLEKPIKEVGEHEIEAKVLSKTVTFKINIVAA